MCFFDGETPVFISVDDIQFVKPVTVGSVMEFTSTIVYSQDLFIVVQVRTHCTICMYVCR
jgi:acyl-CoA hydrolase